MALDIAASVTSNRVVRQTVARESFYWFFNIYFSHYVKYETAEFQREIFSLLESDNIQMLVFCAFRGSGKSTIVTMAYVLWAILGKQQKKYAVIAGQTQRQARQHLQNIKRELESNPILRGDLGPFKEEDEWGSLSLVISNCGAKITAASTEQSIRGMRHGQHRPDLIICDDVEDLGSVQTMESRDKTYRWFTGDVVPSGDKETRVILVGNLLHSNSLIMRLKKSIENGDLSGVFKRYPLIESGLCLWPGKFPDKASIATEQKKVGSHNAWMREYMLVIIPESDQVVFPEWITHYDLLPSEPENYAVASADLAISESNKADCTAIIRAKVYGSGNKMRIYILPHPVNARLNFPKQLETMREIHKEHNGRIKFLVEDVGYQRALVQTLEQERYLVEGIKTGGQDKRARLSLATPYLKAGAVLFPKTGAEELIQQLLGFGVERDDLADAFSMLVNYCAQAGHGPTLEDFENFVKWNTHPNDVGSIRHKRF